MRGIHQSVLQVRLTDSPRIVLTLQVSVLLECVSCFVNTAGQTLHLRPGQDKARDPARTTIKDSLSSNTSGKIRVKSNRLKKKANAEEQKKKTAASAANPKAKANSKR